MKGLFGLMTSEVSVLGQLAPLLSGYTQSKNMTVGGCVEGSYSSHGIHVAGKAKVERPGNNTYHSKTHCHLFLPTSRPQPISIIFIPIIP